MADTNLDQLIQSFTPFEVFLQKQGQIETPDKTMVRKVGPTINASGVPGKPGSGNIFAINGAKKITLNGSLLGGTNVDSLFYRHHNVYYRIESGKWFGPITKAGSAPVIADPTLGPDTDFETLVSALEPFGIDVEAKTEAVAGAETADRTMVTSSGPTINASPTPGTAGSGNVLGISKAGTITLNGKELGGNGVKRLYYRDHKASQCNASGDWYGPITAAGTGASIADPTGATPPVVKPPAAGTVNYLMGIIGDGNGVSEAMAVAAGQPGGVWPISIAYNSWPGTDWGAWTWLGVGGSGLWHVQISPYPMGLPFDAAALGSGAYQAYFDNMAKSVASFGKRIVSASLGWEWNNGGAMEANGANWDRTQDRVNYIRYFRCISRSFQKYCPDVVIVWAMNHAYNRNGVPEDYYPGDKYCGGVGMECYQQWLRGNNSIDTDKANDWGWLDAMSKATFLGPAHPGTVDGEAVTFGGPKYIVVAEWANYNDPSYVQKALAWAADPSRVNRILCMLYWNTASVDVGGNYIMGMGNDAGKNFVAGMKDKVYSNRQPAFPPL
jgi:hypothetical protein